MKLQINYASGLILPSSICKLFLLLAFWALAISGLAQQRIVLTFSVLDEEILLPGKIRFKTIHTDSLSAVNQIREVIRQLHKRAYLLASVDSIKLSNDSITAFVYIGIPLKWAQLKPGNIEEGILTNIGYREKIYRNQNFSYRKVADLEDKLLKYGDNQGYPFASVHLDSVKIDNHKISANIHYNRGPYIIFDSLTINGTARFKSRFLSTYLRILPGQPFSQQKIERAEKLLKQLPYLTIVNPFAITFKNDRAYPIFFADQVKANEIDGIIGFLPNEQASSKLLITGELNLQLRNLFNSGKNFSLKWQQIRQNSPRLDISYEHPALLGTPLIVKGNFNILKEDTTFLTIDRKISLSYHIGKAGKINFYTGLKTSQLGNNAQYREASQLPQFSDFRLFYYGSRYEWSKLDNYFYPTRGFNLSLDAWTGNKKIIKNPFLRQELYENVDMSTVQVMIKAEANKYIHLSPRSVWFTGLKAGIVANANIFKNELFRIGGLTTLRGHNENFFFASDYAILTLEYRFFIDPTSYFFLFYDQAYLKYTAQENNNEDIPLGIGAGVSFKTNIGIFQLIYAVGQSEERKFGLNFSRIHFGLTSRF